MALSLRLAANRLQSSGGAASGDTGEVAAEAKAALWSLRVRYLTVFLLMKFADWLQGSYFYEVYAAKNDSRTGEAFTPSAISSLFLVGFCSAMVCGAFAGSWADKFGRCVGCSGAVAPVEDGHALHAPGSGVAVTRRRGTFWCFLFLGGLGCCPPPPPPPSPSFIIFVVVIVCVCGCGCGNAGLAVIG